MLILYRKKGDAIVINENITISVVDSGPDGVRLAIDAPREVPIMRKELMEAAKANKEAAAEVNEHRDTLLQVNKILKKKEH